MELAACLSLSEECHTLAVIACSGSRPRRHMGEEAGRPATANQFSPNPDTIRAKATQKATPTPFDKDCFCCGRIGHIRADCRAKTHLHGGHPKSAPKGKGAGSCEEEKPETSQNVPLETID